METEKEKRKVENKKAKIDRRISTEKRA